MVCIENLIRLYYLYHGSFDNIKSCNFSDQVHKGYANSSYDSLNNYLYSVLGYNNTSLNPSIDVYNFRKDFCVNSYKPNFKKNLVKKFNCSNLSELIDLLDSKGMLGIERRHTSVLDGYKDCGIPSKFLNANMTFILNIVSLYLNDKVTDFGVKFIDLRKDLLMHSDVNARIAEYSIDYSKYLKVKYTDIYNPMIKDGILFVKPINGYSEEEVRDIMMICYLLGAPQLPMYLRNEFITVIPTMLAFSGTDDTFLKALDISYVCELSIRELLESFGFTVPNPEEMWEKYNGYFTYNSDVVLYCNPSSDSFIEMHIDKFLDLFNTGKLATLDIDLELVIQESEKLNDSELFK